MPAARLLALDTSTQQLVVALTDGGAMSLGLVEEGGARASARLLPAAAELLARAGWPITSLEAIAFARGPGAFTGVRTATAAAQGLALGLDRPALAIDSLEIVADDAWHADRARPLEEGAVIGVAMDARMDEIYAASYRRVGEAWQTVDEPMLIDAPSLAARWGGEAAPRLVAGSALDVFGARLGLHAETLQQAQGHDRAQALARCAQRAWREGRGVDAALALPVYLRDKVAFTTAEREAMGRERAQGAAPPARANAPASAHERSS